MSRPLRVLIVEDRAADAELMLHELRRADFEPTWDVVQSESDYLDRLDPAVDVILADYTLPGFDALSALRLLQQRGLRIPFVVVSGTISEEVAVECMKEGAADYLLKDRLSRLGQAVARAIRARRQREERLRAEEALRESEERYRRIVETAEEGIWSIDADRVVTFANSKMAELLGCTVDEVIGAPLLTFVGEEERRGMDARLELRSRGVAERFDFKFRRKDGADLWAIVSAHPLVDSEGQYTGSLAMVTDITDRRRAEEALRASEEQLRQSQKLEAIGLLAGGVAHDFNNMLTAVIGFSNLLRDQLDPADPRRAYAEEISKAGHRAADLTRKLLAFSRRQVLHPEVLDLNAIVADMDALLQRLIGDVVDLISIRSPGLGSVEADRGQIEQVIVNLAVNARDAMPDGGKLTIETGNVELDEAYAREHVAVQPGPHVMLAVSDTGCGMDRETQAHIFEPFFTTKEPGKGTGLGLATAYGIVKQSGGNIWVYSEPGRGTTFKIYLPRVEHATASSAPLERRPPPGRGSETILLVEDEEGVRSLASQVLRASGYAVLEASNAEEALPACERHEGPIDLLLTDVVMPGMGGRELAERVAVLRPDTKVLYMSGYTDDVAVRHGVLQAEMAYLEKPFTPNALMRKIRDVLGPNDR